MECGKIIWLMEQENITGQTEGNMLDNGWTIKCMEKGDIHGKVYSKY